MPARENDRLREIRARMEAQPRVLKIEPKGFHHPAFRQAQREIEELEREIGLARCGHCTEWVMVSEQHPLIHGRLCASCARTSAPPPAAA